MSPYESEMTLAEAEAEEIREKSDELRHSLSEDYEWLGQAICSEMGYDPLDTMAYLAMLIYRASKFIDRLAQGDRIDDIPYDVGLSAFRELLSVKISLVNEIDAILDNAVAEQMGSED